MGLTAPVLFSGLARNDCRQLTPDLSEEIIRWLVDAGLGPITLSSVGDKKMDLPADLQQHLLAVDLSARFESSARTDALLEILSQAGPDAGIGLLKGMLFAHNFYAQPHFRPMGDIDLLTAPEKTNQLTKLLHDLGYINAAREEAAYFETHHHLMPFHLPGTNVWIEVHTGLFPTRSGLAGNGPFDPSQVHRRTKKTELCGFPVLSLTNEMQFFHTTVHWAEEFRRIGGMLGLLDLYMLLNHAQDELDWDWIFSQSSNSMHIAPAQLALSYLERAELLQIPADVKKSLKKYGRLCSTALRVQHAIIDRFVVMGEQPGHFLNKTNVTTSWKTTLHHGNTPLCVSRIFWAIAFPEYESERYTLGFQMKRLRNLRTRLGTSD